VIVSILTQYNNAAMSDIDCGEGMVRDLDGSCVKKFIIPSSRRECPKLSVDNGEIFLLPNGRMVKFYCELGYLRVPDTDVAICQVTGSWSKTVPACLMPGCEEPPSPSNGHVDLLEEYDNTVAVFRCEVGHELTGDQVLGCVDGVKWNGTVPECREVVSDQPDEDRRSTSAASPKRISNDSVVRTMLASLLAVMMYCQQ